MGGEAGGVSAVQVTEWEEPQAVIGSYPQRYAYPDYYAAHVANERKLTTAHAIGRRSQLPAAARANTSVAGENGVQVYDVAGIANKGVSERIITALSARSGTTLTSHNRRNMHRIAVEPADQPRTQSG
jgi:hypothetical protein